MLTFPRNLAALKTIPSAGLDTARNNGDTHPKPFTMYTKKPNPRTEYRQQKNQCVQDSPSLEARFPELKTLTVKLAHFDATGSRKGGALKYTVNMAHAKSLFRFDCGNSECLCGDFDLSDELAQAVAAHLETTNGEKRCTGWRNKTTIDNCPLRQPFALRTDDWLLKRLQCKWQGLDGW